MQIGLDEGLVDLFSREFLALRISDLVDNFAKFYLHGLGHLNTKLIF